MDGREPNRLARVQLGSQSTLDSRESDRQRPRESEYSRTSDCTGRHERGRRATRAKPASVGEFRRILKKVRSRRVSDEHTHDGPNRSRAGHVGISERAPSCLNRTGSSSSGKRRVSFVPRSTYSSGKECVPRAVSDRASHDRSTHPRFMILKALVCCFRTQVERGALPEERDVSISVQREYLGRFQHIYIYIRFARCAECSDMPQDTCDSFELLIFRSPRLVSTSFKFNGIQPSIQRGAVYSWKRATSRPTEVSIFFVSPCSELASRSRVSMSVRFGKRSSSVHGHRRARILQLSSDVLRASRDLFCRRVARSPSRRASRSSRRRRRQAASCPTSHKFIDFFINNKNEK